MFLRICGLLTLSSFFLAAATSTAQEKTALETEIQSLRAKFDETREEFRSYLLAIQQIGFRYINANSLDEAYPHLEKFDDKVKGGNEILRRLQTIGVELFDKLRANNKPIDDELAYFISKTVDEYFQNSQYNKAYELSKDLVKYDPSNKFAEVYQARSGLLTNRFGEEIVTIIKANKDHFQKEDVITSPEKILINNIYALNEMYQEELAIRKREAQANDLPLISLNTSKGKIEIELFEDSAPDTVGNIVQLTENKHYDGLFFHGVIDKAAAETGILDSKLQRRTVNYKIYDEKPIRNIFAGSVVMISEERNTGDTRFFIATAALPNITGKATVFGRVKTGMDVVYALNKTHKMEEDGAIPIDDVVPDQILTATVIRKRDHEYAPRKVSNENEEK